MMETLTPHSDAWWTLIGLGIVALGCILVWAFMKWESKRATSYYVKKMKK